MSVNYKHIFNLKDNFTKEELKNSYLRKIQEVNNNIQIKAIDKQFWLQQLNSLYFQGKQDISRRHLTNNFNLLANGFNQQLANGFNQQLANGFNQQLANGFNQHNIQRTSNNGINSMGYSKSYKSVTGNDGITYVEESSKTINNDNVNTNYSSYKIDKYGRKTFINPNQIK